MPRTSPLDALLAGILQRVDTNATSRWIGAAARMELPPAVLGQLIDGFVAAFGVDLTEAAAPKESYRTFDEFFVRRLRAGCRPIADAPLVSPCDGVLLEVGDVADGTELEVKGSRFTLPVLLRSEDDAARFAGGTYWTIYLSPKDYHRVHAPCAGRVRFLTYVPGRLFPVNAFGLRAVDRLYEVNERVSTFIEREDGSRVAVVLVGAHGVGSIELCYDDFHGNRAGARPESRSYPAKTAPPLAQGAELGAFHLGSSVIVVAEAGTRASAGRAAESELRMGEPLGYETADDPAGSD